MRIGVAMNKFKKLATCMLILAISIVSVYASKGNRTLILNGVSISEKDTDNGFTSWYCSEFLMEEKLFEVGYFSINGENCGFILYDNSDSGEVAYYSRKGLNHRWDWPLENGTYSLWIKPDGTALYYDFEGVPAGQSTRASDVYTAHKVN